MKISECHRTSAFAETDIKVIVGICTGVSASLCKVFCILSSFCFFHGFPTSKRITPQSIYLKNFTSLTVVVQSEDDRKLSKQSVIFISILESM